jgi:hypothetical protein
MKEKHLNFLNYLLDKFQDRLWNLKWLQTGEKQNIQPGTKAPSPLSLVFVVVIVSFLDEPDIVIAG